MRKVLIANRGEIAVRLIRACRDAGLASVAVYADPDRDAPHAGLADEAFALDGSTATATYLDVRKLLAVARRAGADAVHPGYGFLAENADFAQAVLDAGCVWIGPTPDAIRRLGDKVEARHIAHAVGAPLVPGTAEPVSGVDEVAEFVRAHGLPVAIKAAYGGGGRGLKVARRLEDIEEMYASAVREATAAFGRGECYVERYLDRPRHVEAQVLADSYGSVVVVGDRDCSLQRRHQKLVEEAPAPFLTDEQRAAIHRAAHDICEKAGYLSAGTVEFLVGQDGTISFLEVNTRLQVEHPITEEVTGIDLVREMFRIADGQRLEYETPQPRGHAIEFRINGEDPGRGFLPTPGRVRGWEPPSGPGVRVDSGVTAGSVVSQSFDSLLAKLIVRGGSRREALERSRRALAEFAVDGVATVLPFHRAVVDDQAFCDEPFSVHTRWIETEFQAEIAPYLPPDADSGEPPPREPVVVEVGGRRVEVVLPASLLPSASRQVEGVTGRASRPPRHARKTAAPGTTGATLASPMQGTIVKVMVAEGERVQAGDLVVVLEAMKMEQPITAHRSGVVRNLMAAVGVTVNSGAPLCDIEEA